MFVRYRLGIDIGTNSLGWCLLELDHAGEPCRLLDIGVRIFKDGRDPKSRASLAATRRLARAMRRQRDRRLGRKHLLIDRLVSNGLMPRDPSERKTLEALDPYLLRAEGLDRALTPHEFGRALFHLAQRRGFQSNLKTDRASKSGVTKEAQAKLREAAASYRTLGEYLHRKGVGIAIRTLDGKVTDQRKLVRFRPHAKGAKVEYDLYPTRAMYRDEFERLWAAQQRFGLKLSKEAFEEIARAIFHQRKLKDVPVGKCTFEPDDRRAPIALPTAQRFRILQEVNNLEWIGRDRRGNRLTQTQREKILRLMERQKSVSFDKMRGIIGEGSEIKFNLESEKRTKLDGDAVSVVMADKSRFGDRWWRLDLEDRDAIVEAWLAEEDDERLVRKAIEEWRITPEQAESVVAAPLPDSHYRLGRNAILKLLPLLEKGVRYYDAARQIYKDHARLPDGEILDELPYYGKRLSHYTAEVPSASDPGEREFGRLANPTVHVALNQLRRVVNELIREHGHPAEIVIELARELPLGKEELLKREGEQRKNQERNEAAREEIATLLRDAGATEGEVAAALARGDAVLRLRLWKELGTPPDTRCPYTQDQVGIRRLFSHEVHIDHILPFRRTHDDSYANKIICMRRSNDLKGDKTPWEAFHGNPPGYDWDSILLRAAALPKNKAWRFAEDAMEQFKRRDRFGVPKELAEQFTAQDDFLARHLIDTQYLSRVAREYLTAVCDPYKVWPITGGTTALLRGKWNLSALMPTHNIQGGADDAPARKSRLDHRHHAIDAFVVACTSRSMLQRIASAADDQRDRLIETMPVPWGEFRDELREGLRRIVVSHRPDHGSTGIDPRTGRARTTGALHNDTAYFPLSAPEKDGASRVVSRKPIASFETMEEIDAIPDAALRKRLREFVTAQKVEGDKKKTKEACERFVANAGVRKTKIEERLKVIPIRDRSGRVYKAYKGDSNDYMEIWRLPSGQWTAQTVSTFDANSPPEDVRPRPHPAAKLLMRLYNDDLVRLEDQAGLTRTMRIVKTSKQTVVMADHFESGNLKDRDGRTRKAKKALRERKLVDGAEPDAVLADTGGFEYFSRAASSLSDLKFRKLHISPTGRVHDPGPPK
jgi:CRISPR-associated endonuclease Csn1